MHIDLKASSLSFVYPFLFDERGFEARCRAADEAAWSGGEGAQGRLKVWRPEEFCVDDMLSYVADFLNPPGNGAGEGVAPATARLWEIDGNALQSSNGLGGKAAWELATPRGSIPFRLKNIRLALFREGVGFITVIAAPRSGQQANSGEAAASDAEVAVDAWLDFIHYFRFVGGQRAVKVLAGITTGIDPRTHEPLKAPFVPMPRVVVDLTAQAPPTVDPDPGTFPFAHVLRVLLRTAETQAEAVDADRQETWYREVFVRGQMLPFVSLYVDAARDGTDSAGEQAVRLLLYRVRNFFHAGQQAIPTEADLSLDNAALLPYAERQWFVFSLDGGAFVAVDAPGNSFFRQTMPAHLQDQYFLLFTLALQQRFALMKVQDAVARDWLSLDSGTKPDSHRARLEAFARIRDLLLQFTARSYFTQVMQQEHHHRVYRKWQETFQVDKLYQEVSNAVREMHADLQVRNDMQLRVLAEERQRTDRAQEERSRQIERTLAAIVWILGVPGLALSFLDAGSSQDWDLVIAVFLGSLLLGAAIFTVITWKLQRRGT